MLRDLKIFRRNLSKKSNAEEIENVPANASDCSVIQTGDDPNRAPLNTIPEPSQIPKSSAPEQELGSRSKVDRTPSKAQSKGSGNGSWALRTPEKQVGILSSRNKFGWGQKNELGGCGGTETRDEGKDEMNHFPPSSRSLGNGGGGLTNTTPRSSRTVGRAISNHSECSSMQSTPTKSVTKPPNPGFGLVNGSRPPVNMGPRVGSFAALSKGIPTTSAVPMIVNTVEVPHFELREDPSFWMDHNVQVVIRVRPLNSTERCSNGYNRCLKQESAQTIAWIGQPESRFTFDHAACETVNQEMLFRVAGLPIVENCLSGYNSCMFAYGQTGSGKTYTMLGEIDELEVKPSPHRGMTPRIFEFLFARIRAEEESRRDEKLKYNCKCSFLEIYNEQITDLLDPSSSNLLIREDVKNGVYVENLTESEVQTVNDILKLLIEGAANRKVAATNMNRESSRSHSVFTCVIESRWEKDNTTNLRFARLNLVDLAGSERQKTSGAEGERLKEAANINKSLSTLGHVIMLLVDVAHGKQRHIPYRDSKLTFFLQESLGGNSKTMIIANVSPSICSAAETLSTLKFAQRAKLIQNNAVVNEDASGDLCALQHQIRLLKEELSLLKRQNVSRSLSFSSAIQEDTDGGRSDSTSKEIPEMSHMNADLPQRSTSLGTVRMSTKQLKSLETTLAGALRREQMTDASIKQLEAEIEQLNRLVRQREEDTQCTKMMLRFREDKIQRMESLLGGFMPSDTYLVEENKALSEELQSLRARVDKNPEVTRFALENIRLLEKLRRFQDFYEEGEREMLLEEVSGLRNQLLQFLNGNIEQYSHSNLNMSPKDAVHISRENDFFNIESKKAHEELDACRNNLNSCLEINAKLTSEISDLHSQLNNLKSVCHDQHVEVEPIMGSAIDVQEFEIRLCEEIQKEKVKWKHENIMKHIDEIMNLQLELDILKIILQEERSSHGEMEEKASCLSGDLEIAKEECLKIRMQLEAVNNKLKDANSVIDALECQQILSINELEELRERNSHYLERLSKQEQEITTLKEQLSNQELKDCRSLEPYESDDSMLQTKLKRMHDSLEKAKKLNMWYQGDRAFQASNEQEMDEIRRQVEAETAEVIVCLQEELTTLQQQVNNCNAKEIETKQSLLLLESQSKDLQECLYSMTQDKERLCQLLTKKEEELQRSSEDWENLAFEIEEIMVEGHEAIVDASDQAEFISSSFPKKTWISEQVGRMIRNLSEKELRIEELEKCLEDAQNVRIDMDWKLRSLRGAALAITEVQQHESCEKEKEILSLTSLLHEKTFIAEELENKIKIREDQIRKAELCATVAFVIVKRLSEINSDLSDALKNKDTQFNETTGLDFKKDVIVQDHAAVIEEAENQIQDLRIKLEGSEETCAKLNVKLVEADKRICHMERQLEMFEKGALLEAREKIDELKLGVSALNSCVNEYAEKVGTSNIVQTIGQNPPECAHGDSQGLTQTSYGIDWKDQRVDASNTDDVPESSSNICMNTNYITSKLEHPESGRTCESICDTDLTILRLRKEIESALESLKGTKSQIAKLLKDQEEIQKSKRQSQESMDCFSSQFLALQAEIRSSEEQSDLKMWDLDHKILRIEAMAQETKAYWFQKKEVLEIELNDAKEVAAQKSAEASILLAKFEEAQETMKEADVMVNALMKAKETARLEIERLKIIEARLTDERDFLIDEVQSLRTSNEQKDKQYKNQEMQFSSDLSELKTLVCSLDDAFTQVQDTSDGEFQLMLCDLHQLKSQIQQSTNLTRSWLEDIWSEIIGKDCALSVLHLCHMGVLLEAATGLNAENGLLNHGLSESNSIMAELKEHNSKTKRELQICKILKGKLLVDIKNSFDRILRKEDETGKINAKLNFFEKKILDLQLQEELMLARSNSMGNELSVLIKELDVSNKNAFVALSDQEKVLKEREELVKSQVEFMEMDLSAKDFESLIFALELKQMVLQNTDLERQQEKSIVFLANIEKELVLCMVQAEIEKLLTRDRGIEVAHLKEIVEENDIDRSSLSEKLKQCSSRLEEVNQENEALRGDIQSLKEVACSNNKLKDEFLDIMGAKENLMAKVQLLETEMERLTREWEEMDRKDAELNQMHSIEEENLSLNNEVRNLKADYSRVLDDLQAKSSESEKSFNCINALNQENHRLQEKVCSLETCIASLLVDCDTKNREVEELQHAQSITERELTSKSQDLETQAKIINALKEENCSLRSNHLSLNQNKNEILSFLSSNFKKCLDLAQAVNATGDSIFQTLDEKNDMLLNKLVHEICENDETASKLIAECESLENVTEQIISENLSFKAELLRKDEVLKGLQFDLSLLQESASNAMDQKDELERMVDAMESLEDDLALRSAELDKTFAHSQMLETQLKEKTELISSLELDISRSEESLKLALTENAELKAKMDDLLVAKGSLEEELLDRSKVIEKLEEEIFQLDNALGQMNTALEGLRNDLFKVTSERDHLDSEVIVSREKLETTQALAEENEAIANEAQQISESRKTYAEEKEEEVKLLEKSVEELECTVNVLENKVDIVKGEAERQRLEREDLELELQAIKDQMQSVHTSAATMNLETKNARSVESRDTDLQRQIEVKEYELKEAQKQVKVLEKNLADKEAEISQFKVHLSELNLHAEAQAREYKQKFKALEAMAEQVRPDHVSSAVSNSSTSKQEKNAVKSRGSGSPFKCIGLGLVQQINSEKDEELTAGRLRIEELEALAASRQKEIFMLNARLASAESMTHDVIRDLLGVKLDMTNYASLLDHQQMQKLTEEARLNNKESIVKEQEVAKLKQQLNEFIEERQGWLDEINRRQAEMVAARIASEKLRQREQFLSAENEMLKKENLSHKKKVMELEGEVNKLSGQQNLQQRIHHHTKIKDENNWLKTQNEDLSVKLRRSETILSRVKEELARYRASSGGVPVSDFDEEHRLNKKLRETEEERLQLAEKLLSLCTAILKAAGITRPLSEINLSVAVEALEQLKSRIVTLEGELQDLSFKNRITSERIRLSELKQQQSSPLISKIQEDCTAPFLRTLSR